MAGAGRDAASAQEDAVETLVVDVAEAARLLGISPTSAYAAVHRGEIPSIRLGRLLKVPRAGLAKLLSGGQR